MRNKVSTLTHSGASLEVLLAPSFSGSDRWVPRLSFCQRRVGRLRRGATLGDLVGATPTHFGKRCPTTSDRPDPLNRLISTAEAIQVLLGLFAAEEPIDEVLMRTAGTAARALPDADAVFITVVSGPEPHTVAYTDEWVLPLDRKQHTSGQGLCWKQPRRKHPYAQPSTHRLGTGRDSSPLPSRSGAGCDCRDLPIPPRRGCCHLCRQPRR